MNPLNPPNSLIRTLAEVGGWASLVLLSAYWAAVKLDRFRGGPHFWYSKWLPTMVVSPFFLIVNWKGYLTMTEHQKARVEAHLYAHWLWWDAFGFWRTIPAWLWWQFWYGDEYNPQEIYARSYAKEMVPDENTYPYHG